jgi:hypothetical protein
VEPTLGRFFADMALDPSRLAAFLDNPDEALKTAGLPEEERLIVRSANPELICDRLSNERGGPASAPWNCPALLAF